jgi:plastocyanin
MTYLDDKSMTKLRGNVHVAVMLLGYTLSMAIESAICKRSIDSMRKLVTLFVLLSLIAAFLTACGNSGSCGSSSTGNSNSSGTPTVYMCGTNFEQSSITISKGQSVMLVNNSSAAHIIANGSWVNGSVQSGKEPGAPVVNNVQIGGNASQTIGPFNTAGTFHLYCTVHPGMNLTVIVQ